MMILSCVIFSILVLMVFNAVLFYKLWCLEATTANFLMLKSAQFNNLASKYVHLLLTECDTFN